MKSITSNNGKVDVKSYDHASKKMKFLENSLDCAGFCKKREYYLFSNYKRGLTDDSGLKPEDSCSKLLLNNIDKYGSSYIAVTSMIFGYFLINVIHLFIY